MNCFDISVLQIILWIQRVRTYGKMILAASLAVILMMNPCLRLHGTPTVYQVCNVTNKYIYIYKSLYFFIFVKELTYQIRRLIYNRVQTTYN